MLNDTRVTLRGNVATKPELHATPQGATMARFRLAVTERSYSRDEQRYVDGATSWYTVTAWRSLAGNVAGCLEPGTSVVVQGRIRVRDYEWEGRPRTSVDVDADSVGVDLTWGTAHFTPNRPRRPAATEAAAGEEAAGPLTVVDGEDEDRADGDHDEADDAAFSDEDDDLEEEAADGRLVTSGAANPF